MEEACIQLSRILFEHTQVYRDAGLQQPRGAAAGQWIGIGDGYNHAGDTGGDDCRSTWWRAPVMVTRFEGDA